MTAIASTPSGTVGPAVLWRSIIDDLWVIVVGGVPFGFVVAGIGSRLAMFALRVTSPQSVIGRTSDDGFEIGVVTVGGTYNLLLLGAAMGVIGAAAYRMVRPWLIGPRWFRFLTVGLATAAVVGSALVHADGVDFQILKPKWFAVALFIALPGVFGLAIGPWIDRVDAAASRPRTRRIRWLLPALLLAPVPFVLFPLGFITAAVVAFRLVGSDDRIQRFRAHLAYGLVVRAAWLGVASLGLLALIGDLRELS